MTRVPQFPDIIHNSILKRSTNSYPQALESYQGTKKQNIIDFVTE